MESMDTVSLQAVTLADGSTAYIQHDSKASFSDGQIMDGQVIQLEDGSAAYVQHVSMPKAGKRRRSLQGLWAARCTIESAHKAMQQLTFLTLHLQEETVYSWKMDKQFS